MKKKRRFYITIIILVIITMQILPDISISQAENLKTRKFMQVTNLPNPICNYNFNNSIGTALIVTRENDTLEGSNSGTLLSVNSEKNAIYKDGISGKGIYLDGTYGLRIFPEINGSDYSISLWVKPESMQTYSPFICAGEQFLTEQESSIEITKDDTASPVVISSSPSGGYFAGKEQAITDNIWNYICVTVSDNNVKIYVNGKLKSEGTTVENMIFDNTEWYLGIDPYNPLLRGSVDNLAFYNSCLSAEIISQIYTKEKSDSTGSSVNGIALNKNTVVLNSYGDTDFLYANVQPDNAQNQNVKWYSSNKKVATVENGVIYAWKNGSAVITATTEDGNFEAQCNVTVQDIIDLEGITLSETNLFLQEDKSSATLTVITNPPGTYIPKVIWKTSDKNVATVDQLGNVKAVANGKAIITAESDDKNFSASCQVTVEGLSKNISIESVKFTEDSIELTNKNNTHKLVTVISPANAANQQCTYYSEDEDVAIVDDTGKVTAVGNGRTNICVIASEGRFEALCKVKVTGFTDTKATALKLDHNYLEVAQGGTGYLYVEAEPVTCTQDIYWSSSDSKIADVVADEFGTSAEIIVYADAIMGSTVVITASTEDGVSAECFVAVTEYAVQKLSLEKSDVCLLPGESFNADAVVKPERASSTDLIWMSNNEDVATVDDNGTVTVQEDAEAGESARITSMTFTRQKRASCIVKVKAKKILIKKLSAKKKSFTLYPGNKAKFSVDYSPSNATENKIIYQSQNPKIVQIDKHGNISVPSDYKGIAEVKVTAKSKNGKKVTGIVKVKQKEIKIKRLSMSRSTMSVYGGRNTTLYVNYKPTNATKANVSWKSSNPKIVRVIGNGRRASIQTRNNFSKGNATITAKDSNGAMASCMVSVYPKPVAPKPSTTGTNSTSVSQPSVNQNTTTEKAPSKVEVTGLSFGRQSYIILKPGSSKSLTSLLSITPSNAEYTLHWSSNSRYVSVTSPQGVASVAAKAAKGVSGTILVKSNNGKSATIKITVQ